MVDECLFSLSKDEGMLATFVEQLKTIKQEVQATPTATAAEQGTTTATATEEATTTAIVSEEATNNSLTKHKINDIDDLDRRLIALTMTRKVWPKETNSLQMDEDDEIFNLVDLQMYMLGGGWKWKNL
uniref:Uncharacterized protein n=1 Tax=Tanacetum cinerariifolium TaxID=118510 RepID=A0A699H9E8_TANCI|nr:hypothetical protein [Tanacetum cinerariifolium]